MSKVIYPRGVEGHLVRSNCPLTKRGGALAFSEAKVDAGRVTVKPSTEGKSSRQFLALAPRTAHCGTHRLAATIR